MLGIFLFFLPSFSDEFFIHSTKFFGAEIQRSFTNYLKCILSFEADGLAV